VSDMTVSKRMDKMPMSAKQFRLTLNMVYAELEQVYALLKKSQAETAWARTETANVREDLDAAGEELQELRAELHHTRDRLDKALTREERTTDILTRRTTALCALLDIPDPRWAPSKEDLENK